MTAQKHCHLQYTCTPHEHTAVSSHICNGLSPRQKNNRHRHDVPRPQLMTNTLRRPKPPLSLADIHTLHRNSRRRRAHNEHPLNPDSTEWMAVGRLDNTHYFYSQHGHSPRPMRCNHPLTVKPTTHITAQLVTSSLDHTSRNILPDHLRDEHSGKHQREIVIIGPSTRTR